MSAVTRISGIAPVLCVSASRPMIDYFVEKLGFRVQGSVGDPPAWASLARDGAEVMIVCGDYPAPAADWAAYVWNDAVDALHEELKRRGADIIRPPTDKPYGCREIEARLPDGRLVCFAQSLT